MDRALPTGWQTETELDGVGRVLSNQMDRALYAAQQPIATLGRVRELLERLQPTPEQQALVAGVEQLRRTHLDRLEHLSSAARTRA